MKRLHSALLLSIWVLFFAVPFKNANGQKNVQLLNSIEVLNKGLALYDSGAYEKAAALFEQISRNDTNYVLALFEDALSRESNSEDSLAIVLCNKGLEIPSEYEPDFYKLKGAALTDWKKYDQAIDLLHGAIGKFPNVYALHFTLGLAFYKAQRYDSAIAALERSISLNAFHASSHYYLGKCCLEQGRIIPALLSLQFSLVLEPRTTRSFTAVQLIERVTENKYDFNNANKVDPVKYDDAPFTDLELLVQSQAALSKQYKAKSKINYNVIKQCQLIYDKLKYVPNTGNFWMNTYVPFFADMRKLKYFNIYSYYIMQSVNDDNLQNDIKKQKKKIDQFVDWASKEIVATRHTRELTIEGKKVNAICYYYPSHSLQAVGGEDAKGKQTGEWTYYYENNGAVSAKGSFGTDGSRKGLWQYFYFDGTRKERTTFNNGKKNGISETWYENGAPRAKYFFKDNLLDSEAVEYNASGIISAYAIYKQNQPRDKAMLYYPDGKQEYALNYGEIGLEGEQKEYYVTGQQQFSSMYLGGKKNGTTIDYWSNGKVKDSGENRNNEATGHWKFYHEDGSLREEVKYNEGKPFDVATIYYRNGKKEEEISYGINGKVDGPDMLYDDDGIKYEQIDYQNDIEQHYIFMDKNGKTLSEANVKNKKLHHENYYPDGIKHSEGDYINAVREGEWKFYSYTGALETTESYSAGELDGTVTNYYVNGKIKDEIDYKEGAREGYYKKYNIDGTIACEGWYVAGKMQGDWYYYNLRGGLESHYYYLNDNEYGYVDFYNPNGNISEEDYFRLGYFDKAWTYDSTGKNVIYAYASDKGNGHYFSTYTGGQPRVDCNYVSGKREGTEKFYYYNGKLSDEGNSLLGKWEGTYKAYYENGDIRTTSNYSMGDLTGIKATFFKDNKLNATYNYYQDDLNGPFLEFYEHGSVQRMGQCSEGMNEGRFNYYSDDSLLYCVRWYHKDIPIAYSYPDKNGQLVPSIILKEDSGRVNAFYANGNRSLECTYIRGTLNGKRIQYYSNGNVFEIENYYYGNLMGPQKYYYSSGKAKADENYYLGEKDGKCIYYYDTGKIEHEENWVLGDKQGTCIYYDRSGNTLRTAVYYNNYEVYEFNNDARK